jgi:cilia- and flagella-associated protein 52
MERQSNQPDEVMELEHAIGYSGRIVRSVYLHPNGKDFVYISGACIVICDLQDPHQQSFLRSHDDQVTCLAVSNSGQLLASGISLVFFVKI